MPRTSRRPISCYMAMLSRDRRTLATDFFSFGNLAERAGPLKASRDAKTRLPLFGGPVAIPFGIHGDFHGTAPRRREAGNR